MRYLAAIAAVLALAALLTRTGAESASDYRVDAIFDTAKGIVPGQTVKIAGAKVGSVDDVSLTEDFKARIEMTVDRRFAPFRSDARCEIRPEALIAENFVNCDPGTPDGEPLEGEGGEAPAVPLERTTVPVNLTDLFNIMTVPARERLPLVVNTLGLSLAGRGDDLNEIIRRANPTLEVTRGVLRDLSRQRAQLQQIVDAADRVTGRLARRPERVRDFIEEAADVTTRTGERRDALAETVRRLPPFLDAARPALQRLDRLAADGTPVLSDLRAAAPGVNRLVAELRPFAIEGLPALREIGEVARLGLRTARRAGPLVADLRRLASEGIPTADLLEQLFTSLRDRGFVEGLLDFTYGAASGISRYDAISHVLPARFSVNECSTFASVPAEGCSARYSDAPTGAPAAEADSAATEQVLDLLMR